MKINLLWSGPGPEEMIYYFESPPLVILSLRRISLVHIDPSQAQDDKTN